MPTIRLHFFQLLRYVFYNFIPFVFAAQLILFAVHWFVYKTAVHFFGITNSVILLDLKLALFLLAISFPLSSILVFRYAHIAARLFYVISALWIGWFYFFLLASTALWIASSAANIFSWSVNGQLLALILFVMALLAGAYALFNAHNIRITSITVPMPNLPKEWQGKKAVLVSDVHLGAIRNLTFSKNIAKMISGLLPDIVFIGGDFYDGVAADLYRLAEPFAKISSTFGVYFITGNHEGFSDKQKYLSAISAAGIHILDNEAVVLCGMQIVGVDYRDTVHKERLRMILEGLGLNRSEPSILLRHVPNHLDIADGAGISLQLSGHAHNGQIFPANLLTAAVYHGYDYGLKKYRAMFVYTASGVGTYGPPMRFGSRPEIVVIEFSKRA